MTTTFHKYPRLPVEIRLMIFHEIIGHNDVKPSEIEVRFRLQPCRF